MSTSTTLGLNLPLNTLRQTIPYLTATVHTTSVLSGIYFLLRPSEGAKLFGLPFTTDANPTRSELAFTRLHGVRDISLGLVGLRLVNYAWELESRGDLAGARGVGVAVGGVVFVGLGFLLGDGWICVEGLRRGADVKREGNVDEEEVRGAVWKHLGLAVPIATLGAAWLYL